MNYRYRNDREMRDSGIEWLGKIPINSNVISIKYVIKNIQTGSTPSTAKNEYFDGDIKWFTPGDFTENKYLNRCKRNISEVAIKHGEAKLMPKETVALVGIGATLGKVAILNEKSSFNQQITGILTNNELLPEILYYWLKINQDTLLNLSNFTTLPIVNNEFIKNFPVILFNKIEQLKIAEFLNIKIDKFDSIISKKEALIEKLEEAKKSLISEVVTGKVKVVKSSDGYELVERKKEEMKDSGVEWLGEIPREWKLEKGKWLFFNSNEKGNENNILLSATQDRGVIPKDELDSVVQNKEDTDFTTFKLVKKYDFIISLRSFQGGFEMSEYDNGIITPAYSVLRAKTLIEPYYYKYLLKEKGFIGILNSLTVGIRDGKNIKYDDFAKVFIPKPSIDEQSLIANYIKESVSNINLLMNKTIKQIEKLKEAKQSLISEAVTGKIEILD